MQRSSPRRMALLCLALALLFPALGGILPLLPAKASAATVQQVWGWGNNIAGQLGDATTAPHLIPTLASLPSDTTVTAVSAGYDFSLALTSTGTLYAWGRNTYGQLGDGTTVDRYTPVAVTMPAGVTFIAISSGQDSGFGRSYNLALSTNGTTYSWGNNSCGQLGDGTTTARSIPLPLSLPGGVQATAVAAGDCHALALAANGTVYAWGSNYNGELGNVACCTSTPVQVNLPAGVIATAIAAGDGASLALATDGSIYGTGSNIWGKLSTCGSGKCSLPVRITLPNGVKATAIGTGAFHSMAIGNDGDRTPGGGNNYGQLGDGTPERAVVLRQAMPRRCP